MSTVKADTVQPKDFATDLTLGASGDTVTVAADSININKVQDKGGNTLWDYSTGVFVGAQKEFASQNLKLLSTSVASGSESVSFITGIDSTYDVYIFKFINIKGGTDLKRFGFQFNAVGQSGFNETITSTHFDAYHYESGDPYGPELRYNTGGDQAQGTGYQDLSSGTNTANDESLAGELHLFNPSSTTYVKHFYATTNYVYGASGADSAASFNDYVSGYVNTTAAIDEISFKMTAGNVSGTIKMYGLL